MASPSVADALHIAKYLAEHSKVERVYYPGLDSHPQHGLARRQMCGGFGGLLSFEMQDFEAGNRFVNAMTIPARAVSFGGNAANAAGMAPGLIRLAIGLEYPADLIEDLDRILSMV